jgi:aromatic-L-amino-acid decarboxylase
MASTIGAVTRAFPLEPTAGDARAWGEQVLDYLVEFVERRSDAPASDFDGVSQLVEQARQPIPEHGRPLAELLEFVAAATAKGHDTTGDGWLAYVPGGGLFTSALGEFIARTTNRFVGVWEPAPVLVQVEATVIRWLCELFGYGAEARGVLTTGGSLATFSGVVTARQALVGDRLAKATVYVSDETHGAAAKAATLAGFARTNVRVVPTTPRRTMDPMKLQAVIANDLQNGFRPCLVVASAGTVNKRLAALEELLLQRERAA